MVPIFSSNPDNVILFPKTIEYYQNELTKMLEGERFAEAARLLRFLLQCQSDDPQYKEEWRSLLEWLTATFPHLDADGAGAGTEHSERSEEDDEEETEGELFKRHVRAKAANDSKYTEKLLAMLDPRASAEKQLMALDQLVHLDRRTVGEPLKLWLEESRLHPLVQFRGLQALRTLGETGMIGIRKLGQSMTLPIGETPLRYEQFPAAARNVLERTRKAMESNQPGLAELAESIWRDFLAFLYGSSVYDELSALDDTGTDVWAAALHHTVQETLLGPSDESDLSASYGGLAEADPKAFHKALQVIKLFATVANPGDM
ncbi:hypothetical protein FE783_01835 [Paenibacillus mesophilus]|uniref:hypothetical protein n=1 Tax=Paenibacillus mesophilus TaxID=2582849 RepID=UPI00110DB7C3|nr:hypothetical protein [Paenibacillus mesophilus]TMV52952.1 hypothetical protein FE783_01835 [Paenibacillus mesophilus]